MGSPLPPVHLQYHADTPINISINKTKKVKMPPGTFHFPPSYRHQDRHPDTPTCMMVAPDTLQLPTNFDP